MIEHEVCAPIRNSLKYVRAHTASVQWVLKGKVKVR
jgi:hypothetical protein